MKKKGRSCINKKWALRDHKGSGKCGIFGFQPVGSGGDMERFGGGPSSLGAGFRAQLETHQYRMCWWLVGGWLVVSNCLILILIIFHHSLEDLHLQVGSNHRLEL